jgi:hypothetical protein
LFPQEPQFASSELVSTQLPEQFVCPALQLSWHAPEEQTSPVPQLARHAPQFFGSS